MESDSVRTMGDSVLVDLWIEGKFRAITVSRQAIEAYLQLGAGEAAAMGENDRREFVRTHLSLVVKAATARLREEPGAERIAIDQLGPIPHASRLIWPLVFGPILVLTGWLLMRGARDASRDVRRLTLTGLGALVLAVLMEAATPVLFALGQGHGSIPYELESVIEEGLELGGFVLIATALAAGVAERFSGAPSPATDR